MSPSHPSGHGGATGSLWMATSPETGYPALTQDTSADVAVLGAGMAGLCTALLLAREGVRVVVIDTSKVGSGTSGHSTAKVTSSHSLIYDRLTSSFDEETARTYGEANQAGLELIASWVKELTIDCDFRRRANYVYTESSSEISQIESEVAAAAAAGLPASFTDDVPLPWDVPAAVRFDDQAEFHPRKFLVALAQAVAESGGRVHEETRAVSLHDGKPCRVETSTGATLSADRVIVATHAPIFDRGLFFAREHAERSYVVAARLKGAVPEGMFLSTESPSHSVRSAPENGGELVLVGGEGHRVGQGGATPPRYRRLEAWARAHFDVDSVDYRWSSQDPMPADGLPYVGRLTPLSDRTLVATGFQKWGYTNGAAAARILSDAVLGRPNAWADLFGPNRLNRNLVKGLAKDNANVALQYAKGWTRGLRARELSDVAPGDGLVMRRGNRPVAVSRDDDGSLQAVSAICTHLQGIVQWNGAERTWDCPCHASRFAADGTVLEGPAVKDLPAVRLEP